jgi:hypothetical protein
MQKTQICITGPQCVKNTEISDFMKIRPMAAMLFLVDEWTGRHAARHTVMTKLIVAFCNYVNLPNIDYTEQSMVKYNTG